MFCPQCGASVPEGAAFCARCGAAVSSATSPGTTLASPTATVPGMSPGGFRYAGFWRRVGASILDGLVLTAATIPVTMLLGFPFMGFGFRDPSDLEPEAFAAMMGAMLLGNGISFAVSGLYYALLESSSKQATLGKMALGIRVADLAGRRISFPRAIGRYFARLLSTFTLCIGYLIMLFTQRRQTLHDLVAGTVVVRE